MRKSQQSWCHHSQVVSSFRFHSCVGTADSDFYLNNRDVRPPCDDSESKQKVTNFYQLMLLSNFRWYLTNIGVVFIDKSNVRITNLHRNKFLYQLSPDIIHSNHHEWNLHISVRPYQYLVTLLLRMNSTWRTRLWING